MQKYQNSYAGPTGIVIAGATVSVMKPDGSAATIYSDNGVTPITSLVTARDGEFAFYAANGRYRIILSKFGLRDEVVEDVLLFDPADNGSAQVGFVAAGAGAVARTAQDKMRETVSVLDKGADPSGLTSSLNAFAAAYAEAIAGSRIRIPPGNYAGVSGFLAGTKFVIWEADGQPNGGGLWYLPGLVQQGFATRRINVIGQTVADGDNKNSFVREASHTGGSPGFVCTNVTVSTNVGANNTNFEWGLLSILNNSAATGENVAIYGQGNKLAVGPTWAGVFEARDKTGQANPTAGLLGLEVDIFANGTDTNNNRIGVDLVVGKGLTGSGDAAPEAYAALRASTANGSTTNGEWLHALVINSSKTSGIRMRQIGLMGADFSEATFNDATVANMAVRLKGGQKINFNAASARTLRYEPSTSTLRYATGTATLFEVADDGATKLYGQLQINGSQVLVDRRTGWIGQTGTAYRGGGVATYTSPTASASYDQSQINALMSAVQAVTRRQKALEDDLITHGLIGV